MRCPALVLLLAALALIAHAEEDKYTDKYDGIDIQAVLTNEKLRTRYLNCFLGDDARACLTPDAKLLKEILPEAVVTKCRKCTDKQKAIFGIVAEWFYENEPETFKQIVEQALKQAMTKGISKTVAEE